MLNAEILPLALMYLLDKLNKPYINPRHVVILTENRLSFAAS